MPHGVWDALLDAFTFQHLSASKRPASPNRTIWSTTDAEDVDALLHIKRLRQTGPLSFRGDVADVAWKCVWVCVCFWLGAGESLPPAHRWSHSWGASGAARSAVRCALPNCVCGKPRAASVQPHSVRGSVCYVSLLTVNTRFIIFFSRLVNNLDWIFLIVLIIWQKNLPIKYVWGVKFISDIRLMLM